MGCVDSREARHEPEEARPQGRGDPLRNTEGTISLDSNRWAQPAAAPPPHVEASKRVSINLETVSTTSSMSASGRWHLFAQRNQQALAEPRVQWKTARQPSNTSLPPYADMFLGDCARGWDVAQQRHHQHQHWNATTPSTVKQSTLPFNATSSTPSIAKASDTATDKSTAMVNPLSATIVRDHRRRSSTKLRSAGQRSLGRHSLCGSSGPPIPHEFSAMVNSGALNLSRSGHTPVLQDSVTVQSVVDSEEGSCMNRSASFLSSGFGNTPRSSIGNRFSLPAEACPVVFSLVNKNVGGERLGNSPITPLSTEEVMPRLTGELLAEHDKTEEPRDSEIVDLSTTSHISEWISSVY